MSDPEHPIRVYLTGLRSYLGAVVLAWAKMIAGPVIAVGGVLLRAFRVPTEVPIGHWLFDVPLTATVLLLFVAAYTHWSETRKKDEERVDQEKAAELLNRDQEAARLRATIARLETEAEAYLQRLTPQLRIDGVEERTFSIREAYDRAEPWILELRIEGNHRAHIREVTPVKVLKVTNTSDVAIPDIHVEITDSSLGPGMRLPYALEWFNSRERTGSLGPGVSAFVTLGWKLQLGVSLPGGQEHTWWAGIEMFEAPEGATIEVKAWALPNAVAKPRTFQFGRVFENVPSHIQDIELVSQA